MFPRTNPARSLAFFFSTHYDVITIGPHANRVARRLSHCSTPRIRCLTIEQQPSILQPSLATLTSPLVPVLQHNHQHSDIETGVNVSRIDPHKCTVSLNNGRELGYRHLVYAGTGRDWRQPPQWDPTVHQHICTDYGFENLANVRAHAGGNVVFWVPRLPHFGYENYLMLWVRDIVEGNGRRNGRATAKVYVVCEGDRLSPCAAFNQILEQQLQKHGIEVTYNANVSVDPDSSTISFNNKSLPFSFLFQHSPLRTPSALTNSGIDPFDAHPHTLHNKKYENIYVLGNILGDMYNIGRVDQMVGVIAQNVRNGCIGVSKRASIAAAGGAGLWLSQHHYQWVRGDGGSVSNKVRASGGYRYLSGWARKLVYPQYVQAKINKDFNILG